jgi:hypothetical protein
MDKNSELVILRALLAFYTDHYISGDTYHSAVNAFMGLINKDLAGEPAEVVALKDHNKVLTESNRYLQDKVMVMEQTLNSIPREHLFQLNAGEKALADAGKKIEAIKSIRMRLNTCIGLREAKDLVEAYMAIPK